MLAKLFDKILDNSTVYGWVTEEEDRKIKIKLWIGALLFFTFNRQNYFFASSARQVYYRSDLAKC